MDFVAKHQHFLLVLLPSDKPQCWILLKLKADGAVVQSFPYRPFLFEVKLLKARMTAPTLKY